MPVDREDDGGVEVPLTPLIDVVFLLLIFFLVATNFVQKEVDHEVRLPEAGGGAPSAEPAERLVLNVRAGGAVVVEGRVVPEAELARLVTDFHQRHPASPVVIRGDRGVVWDQIAGVMGVCRTAGVELVDLPVQASAGKGDGT